jgi:hypothetical protein
MTVRIIETGVTQELHIYTANGLDWITDFVGNSGDSFDYDEESGEYSMTQEQYDWYILAIETSIAFDEVLADIHGRNDSPALLQALYDLWDDHNNGEYTATCGREVIQDAMYDLFEAWEED